MPRSTKTLLESVHRPGGKVQHVEVDGPLIYVYLSTERMMLYIPGLLLADKVLHILFEKFSIITTCTTCNQE